MAPLIDRDLNDRTMVHRGRKGVKASVAIVACVLTASASLMLTGDLVPWTETWDPEDPGFRSTVSYAFHLPILIEGDAQFNLSNGVVSGDGTPENPYIIEGWDISTTWEIGIHIRITTAHFIIRNCYVHGFDFDNGAINLFRCVNGIVEDNICSGNSIGIGVGDSSNNTLSRNNCSDNGHSGISIYDCSNITVSDNYCSDNGWTSIRVEYTDNSTVSGNTCSGRVWEGDNGISLRHSNGNTISNNTCIDHYWCGIYVGEYSDNNTLSGNDCTRGDFGIRLEDSDGNVLLDNACWGNHDSGVMIWYSDLSVLTGNNCSDNHFSGIFLRDSHDSMLSNNTCSENWEAGTYLFNSNGNILSRNNCSDNFYYGLYVSDSSNNTIFNNSCSGHLAYGMYVLSDFAVSANNRIWNNSFHNNNGAGDVYDPAHIQARDDGTGNWWNSTEGYGNYWSDWRGPDLSPMDGIVDYPYHVGGSAGSWDHYPIAEYYGTEVPELGVMPLVVMVLLAMIVLTGEMRRRKWH
jgi:parallel beta-helix repeat protein